MNDTTSTLAVHPARVKRRTHELEIAVLYWNWYLAQRWSDEAVAVAHMLVGKPRAPVKASDWTPLLDQLDVAIEPVLLATRGAS